MHPTEGKQQPKRFHNTIGLQGELLFEANEKAATQQERVLEFLKNHADQEFTGYQIQNLVLPNSPRTSAGRALTNLEKAGWITKTGNKVKEQYGMDNNTYKYKKPA